MEKDNKQPMVFFPDFLFREAIAAAIVVIAVIGLSLAFPMKVGDPADPSDSSFKPRPEWYFMAPFYLLKIVPAKLELIPTVVAPTVIILFLIIMPFLDRQPERRPSKRPLAMALIGGGLCLTIAFTILGILS
jgi:quinol-cytochrome oxidoreductase complex cytochrome b subunit